MKVRIQCGECKYKDDISKFLLSKESKILNNKNYSKEIYKCPKCGKQEETDWLIDD